MIGRALAWGLGVTMKIATWNINGVKARIETALAWLKEAAPDVVCLQEIKSVDEGFPGGAFEELGYTVATHGQKGFNGVAILSRLPLEDVLRGLPGDDGDPQARYIEATVSTPKGAARVASIYLPNGNPIGTEKFAYKLGWMQRLDRARPVGTRFRDAAGADGRLQRHPRTYGCEASASLAG